jgi:hypothetical protein
MAGKAVISKRGRGRPVTIGASVNISGKWQPALVERIDAWARAEGVGRSAALRRLVELGLKAKGKR